MTDKRREFARQQRWSRLGLALFLSSIPAWLVAAVLGYPPFSDAGLPTVSGWLVIILLVAPGLGLMLSGAFCPACRKIVRSDRWVSGRCPHCGTRVRGEHVMR